MSKKVNNFRVFLRIAVFAAVVYLIFRNIGVFGHILLVALGFGAVVLIHEFGHFIVAKLSGIGVETFSIFMPPILLGVRKTEDGLRFRILPRFFPKENDEAGDGWLSFSVGRGGKAGETEYRLGLIPFGGFVKMLGQEDIKEAEKSDDPRSYANKPVGVRMAVIAAGVVFNVISAVIIFMIVFLMGINLSPAVVGGVVPNSSAAHAGLKAGDEIIEVGGKSGNLDFSNIAVAAALSDVNEVVRLKVRHKDGSVEDFAVVAEQLPGGPFRRFGILTPMSLTIAKVSDVNVLFEKTGLLPGDRIRAVNGTDVQAYWEMKEVVRNCLVPAVTVLAERTETDSKEVELIEAKLNLVLPALESLDAASELSLRHIYSVVPRLRIEAVSGKKPSAKKKFMSKVRGLFGKGDVEEGVVEEKNSLKSGDIILEIGEVENPTYKEFREVTEKYEDKELPIKLLRTDANGVEEYLTVSVEPRRSEDVNEVLIGIYLLPVFDAEHAVVAKTVAVEGGPGRLEIPRGGVITAVEGVSVSDFYDVIREIRRNAGQHITIDYRLDGERAGKAVLDVGAGEDFITVESSFADAVPFEGMRRLYKASGPVDAVVMGYKRTVMFILQTYLTLKRWAGGLVSPKFFMGPIGIIAVSYYIVAERALVDYLYFIGLISACIAVVNFLPLLPFDGGHILFLLIEKIKGSAVSERFLGAAAYAGWVLVGGLFLYITFNDIVRIVKSFFIFG